MTNKYPKGEKLLWNIVRKRLEKQFHYICRNPSSHFKFINVGVSGPLADVIGIKEVDNWLNTTIEIVAVEVKDWQRNYPLKNMDQAKRYSIFAHRCYLAAPKEFSSKEIQMAVERGIGLFQIVERRKLEVILPSPQYNPKEYFILRLMDKLGYNKCAICGCFINYKFIEKGSGFNPSNKFDENIERKKWKFVCEKCRQKLPSILDVPKWEDINYIYDEMEHLKKQIKKIKGMI